MAQETFGYERRWKLRSKLHLIQDEALRKEVSALIQTVATGHYSRRKLRDKIKVLEQRIQDLETI